MINIHVGDSYVLVEPRVPQEIEKLLTYWHRSFAWDPKTYKNVVKGEVRKLYTIRQEGQSVMLTTLPGFASQIKALLVAASEELSIIDERSKKPAPDVRAALENLREYQWEGAWTLVHSLGGICSCPTGFGKTYMIAALCKAWPTDVLKPVGLPLTVLVTPNKDLAEKNYNDLVKILPRRNVGLIHSGVKVLSDDIQVVTPESLNHVPMEDCGLLMYDEVHTLTASRAEGLSAAQSALRYGFSATPSGKFDGSDPLITGMFGPVVYTRTYKQAIEDGAVVPIKVFWINSPRPGNWPQCGFQKRDAAYRCAIWRNAYLHKCIKDITSKAPADMQALVVVDKIEQMNGLIPYLEGFTCVHAEQSQKNLDAKGFGNVKAVSPKARRELYEQIATNKIRRILSTGIYRQGINFPNLTLLCNAEGMGSEIIAGQLPGRASRNIDGKEFAYIVDFYRSWDMVENSKGRMVPGDIFRDDKSREAVYTSLGFDQIWVDSVEQINFN